MYSVQTSTANESYSIIRAADLKTKSETIAGLASSIAAGNDKVREMLDTQIKETDDLLDTLRNGGQISGQTITPIPEKILPTYDVVKSNWSLYKEDAIKISKAPIQNANAVNALNYVLERNDEIILTTYLLVTELEVLDRNYITHKEIAQELHEIAKNLGKNALLISINDNTSARDNIRESRILFDIGMKRLLQLPLNDPDFQGFKINTNPLSPIPRESSQNLNDLDLLWESYKLRIKVLEGTPIHSEEFIQSLTNLNQKRPALIESIDVFLDTWNAARISVRDSSQNATQMIIGIDIAIFIFVVFYIRKSLNPLERITHALARVKDGIYGERIDHSTDDEIGQLANAFNKMSETIKTKDEEAKKIDIAKDEFLAMITHELKTPLVPIQGYADMLLGGHLGPLTEKQKERVLIIKSSASSLLQLISDLLDVQKLSLGQLRMKKETTDIRRTVEKSIQALEPQINESGALVINEVKSEMVFHDTDRIIQVITNLMKNSLKAVKPQKGKIRIYSQDDQNNVKIIVEDNGFGIPAENQEKLFTKFYQADTSLTREIGGSGLGLSICKGIVEAHDGTISLQSTPGIGTTVVFTLPKNKAGKTPI
ncbi:MAG: HAMP domain-containing sensor histidine kinase [Candidatus Nitrosotenuis sp.]